MTIVNFNWFLHVMLCLHTKRVFQKRQEKAKQVPTPNIIESEDRDGDYGVFYTLLWIQLEFWWNFSGIYWNFPNIAGKMAQKKSTKIQLHSSESPAKVH
jgi:hypothetical protein